MKLKIKAGWAVFPPHQLIFLKKKKNQPRYLFIDVWVFIATLSLRCCAGAFSSFWQQGYSFMLWAWRHVGSFQIRDQTHVPCTGRLILNCWTTREVPSSSFSSYNKFPQLFTLKKFTPHPPRQEQEHAVLKVSIVLLWLKMGQELTLSATPETGMTVPGEADVMIA